MASKRRSFSLPTFSLSAGFKWQILVSTGQSDIHCKIKETLLIRDVKPTLNENVSSEKLLLY